MSDDFDATVKRVYAAALRGRHLIQIETTVEIHEEAGVEFEIHLAPSLKRKPQSDPTAPTAGAAPKPDPFDPYDPHLFVTELETHHVLLNKFYVVPEHLLVVTKEFQKQTSPLLPADLTAAWHCMSRAAKPTLAFYNCGEMSGASQPHKHLQIIPLPIGTGAHPPIEALFNNMDEHRPGQIYTLTNLPFHHVLTPLDTAYLSSATDMDAGSYLSDAFFSLLDSSIEQMRSDGAIVTRSYNCFFTKRFMVIVPRSSDSVVLKLDEEEEKEEEKEEDGKEKEEKQAEFTVNSLGFTGTLLCRTKAEVEVVRKRGILTVLKAVAVARREEGEGEAREADM
ncbi:ATP adenylyltransferase [Jimgerdemannia flammicorona]|uniref:ATP adenylyltransferase n=1 Tax=Jimgerdemannia flammicorona TaxID=994334 RepID=A0A433PUL5_9FUNG|nr:ATP adenylyltransferase [Jimgerdemannia flammicorona]